MSRLISYFGVVVALVVGVFIIAVSDSVTTFQTPSATTYTASSTVFVLPVIEQKEIEATTSVQTQPTTFPKKKSSLPPP